MKRKIIWVSILILIGAVLTFVNVVLIIKNKENNKGMNKKEDVVVNNVDTEEMEETKKVAIEVNNNSFEEEVIKSDKKVIVDFYSPSCDLCIQQLEILEEIVKENGNTKLVKVNVDENKDLTIKYDIKARPAFIIIENGNEINRSIGLTSKEKVLELL